jgi:hypothetical protein
MFLHSFSSFIPGTAAGWERRHLACNQRRQPRRLLQISCSRIANAFEG